jgi:hypothetical protein
MIETRLDEQQTTQPNPACGWRQLLRQLRDCDQSGVVERPMWVGGGRHGEGIVIAANKHSKKFRLKTGSPVTLASPSLAFWKSNRARRRFF